MQTQLTSISPSSINSFDETTPFGCERRWWFKYVLKNPEPQNDNLLLGEALHLRNEQYLTSGLVVELGQPLAKYSEEISAKSLGLFNRGKPWLDANLKNTSHPAQQASWVIGVEQPLPKDFTVAGVRISHMSKCDVVVGHHERPGIIDWKTTSSIQKYGKTPGGLLKDTQMLLYARAFHPNEAQVELMHGQYETKGPPKFEVAKATLGKNQLDERLEGFIIPLVERMKQTYLVPAARDVKPNRAACWHCPHKGICPSDKVNPLMGIFDKFGKQDSKDIGAVTPPDAPASDPALAAQPVEGSDVPPAAEKKVRRMNIVDAPAPEPEKKPESKAEALRRALAEAEAAEKAEAEAKAKAEAEAKARAAAEKAETEKRGPGRPPGAKNKATLAKEAREALAENGPVFTKTTVNFGATMNMGDFNSVRIDVSHTIEYADGDAEEAFQTAIKVAKQKVEAELEKLRAGPEKK